MQNKSDEMSQKSFLGEIKYKPWFELHFDCEKVKCTGREKLA